MKNTIKSILLTLSTLALTTIFIPAKANITIASYNMTHANKNDGLKREAGNCDVIKELKADIYGFQEVIEDNNQLESIKNTLPNYRYIGETRNSKLKRSLKIPLISIRSFFAQNEYCPIFYNPEKVDLLAHETFGINGDGSGYLPRICTVGKFKQKTTNKEFYVYNTHLDNKQQASRIMQINIIINDIAQRSGSKPVILMGDFNTSITGDMQKTLSAAHLILAKQIARTTQGPKETHEKGSTKELTEIDHILVKPSKRFMIKKYKVLNSMGPKTSDHNPVSMDFTFN